MKSRIVYDILPSRATESDGGSMTGVFYVPVRPQGGGTDIE